MTDSLEEPNALAPDACSTYTGEVTPGGPADARVLPDVTIRKIAVSEMSNNCYLLTEHGSGESLLIDAAAEPETLARLIDEAAGPLTAILTTHQHWDHHRALADIARASGAKTYAGRADAEGLPLTPDVLLDHGDTLTIGALVLDVVQLRGHTPGSVALVLHARDGSTHAFTGDSLFPGGVGNTQKDPERFRSLIDDVEQRLFDVLPDDTWVYPGHGNDTTIGAERPHLAEWRERGW